MAKLFQMRAALDFFPFSFLFVLILGVCFVLYVCIYLCSTIFLGVGLFDLLGSLREWLLCTPTEGELVVGGGFKRQDLGIGTEK